MVWKIVFAIDSAPDLPVLADDSLAWVLAKQRDWAFFTTAATLALAFFEHRGNSGLLDAADHDLEIWDSQALAAIRDFIGFLGSVDRSNMAGAIGLWVLINTAQGQHQDLPHGHMQAAPVVGKFCTQIATNWKSVPLQADDIRTIREAYIRRARGRRATTPMVQSPPPPKGKT